ncbi:MAG TPA: hypothetical protein VGP82_03345 [Ktedonobacterales bacterium]|nr:hypothetical protein [Ktedonobacterales bacterium]
MFFFIEKNNRFVTFHAAQSMLIYLSYFILTIIGAVLIFGGAAVSILSSNSDGVAFNTSLSIAFLLLQCGLVVVGLVHFGLQIWGTVAGFMGTFVSMPLIGGIAERWAGGRPVPLY